MLRPAVDLDRALRILRGIDDLFDIFRGAAIGVAQDYRAFQKIDLIPISTPETILA